MMSVRGISLSWIALCAAALPAIASGGGAHSAAPLLEYLARFHPVLVHFPIALIPAALCAEWLSLRPAWRSLRDTARFCVTLGALAASLASPLGWLAAIFAEIPYEPEWTLDLHRAAGIATVISSGVAAAFAWRSSKTGHPAALLFYRVALHVAAASVMVAGHLGGILSFGVDYFSWPAAP